MARFVGNELQDFQCDGTIPTILSKSSMRLKVLVASGENNQDKIAKLGGKVLGHDKVQAAGQYVPYLYCRQSLLTLMNAYIKGAISKQILRYLDREGDVKLVASFASLSTC